MSSSPAKGASHFRAWCQARGDHVRRRCDREVIARFPPNVGAEYADSKGDDDLRNDGEMGEVSQDRLNVITLRISGNEVLCNKQRMESVCKRNGSCLDHVNVNDHVLPMGVFIFVAFHATVSFCPT